MSKILISDHRIVSNIVELAEFFHVKNVNISNNVAIMKMTHDIEKTIFDESVCGAWFRYYPEDKTVQLGTLIEGTDDCITKEKIAFPFCTEVLFDQLQELDEIVARILAEDDTPWSIRCPAYMNHEGEPEHTEDLVEIQNAIGRTVAYAADEIIAERIIDAVNNQPVK